jgi:hypothetical protein
LALADIGIEVDRLIKLTEKAPSLQSDKKLLSSLIHVRTDGKFYPNLNNASVIAYINILKEVKQDIIDKTSKSDIVKISEINQNFDNAITKIFDSFQRNATYINDWIENSLSATLVENTHLEELLISSVCNPNSSASLYTSQTFGYGYSTGTGNTLGYFAFSIFARPVNNDVPFSNIERHSRWKAKFCLNIGATLEDIANNKNGKIGGLGGFFGNKAGLLGIGYRPCPFLKLDINNLFYYVDDPNPLIKHKNFVYSPLIGISLNLNIIKMFAGQPNSLSSLQKQLKN